MYEESKWYLFTVLRFVLCLLYGGCLCGVHLTFGVSLPPVLSACLVLVVSRQ